MRVKGKRVLKNGALAGYVKQKDGSWKWRIIKGPNKKIGGNNVKKMLIQRLDNIISEFNKTNQIRQKSRTFGRSEYINKRKLDNGTNNTIEKWLGRIKQKSQKELNRKDLLKPGENKKKKYEEIIAIIEAIEKIDNDIAITIKTINEMTPYIIFRIQDTYQRIMKLKIDKLKENETINNNSNERITKIRSIFTDPDKLLNFQYFIIKNNIPILINILKKLSKNEYSNIYDSLNSSVQTYLGLLNNLIQKTGTLTIDDIYNLLKIADENMKTRINELISSLNNEILLFKDSKVKELQTVCLFLKINCNTINENEIQNRGLEVSTLFKKGNFRNERLELFKGDLDFINNTNNSNFKSIINKLKEELEEHQSLDSVVKTEQFANFCSSFKRIFNSHEKPPAYIENLFALCY